MIGISIAKNCAKLPIIIGINEKKGRFFRFL